MHYDDDESQHPGDEAKFTSKGDLGGLLLRFFVLQGIASVGLGVCIAYAYGPAGPKSYAERIDFTLRLEETTGALPRPLDDGFRLRLGLRHSLD